MTGMRGRALRVVVLVGAAMAMTLTACSSSGGSDSATEPSTPPAGNTSSSQGSPSPESANDLYTAAKQEGSLTWYTTFSDDDVQPMIKEFNKKYPGIKVNGLRLSADKIPARVLTEQKGGKYNADVISGNGSYVGQLITAGALEKYSPPDAAPLPEGTDLPEGNQSYTYVTTTVIAYNPAALKRKGLQPPTSFADLAKPEWKGQFSVNPGAVNWYDSMVETLGHDKALKLAQDLGNNSPKLVESHTQALTQVQSGEPAATAMAYGYKASDFKKDTPKQVDFVNLNPLPTGVDLIDVAKKPPHPNAAKLFVDWIVSQDGQQTIVDITNHTSLRDDVTNDKAVWNPSTWKPAWSHSQLPSETFNQYTQELKDAFHAL